MTQLTTSEEKRFTEFPLAPDVIEALSGLGIERPTPIQEACIPAIVEGKDFVGKAETGTGKTIGFGAPLVSRIDTSRVAVQALILTPTRELAQQVAGVLEQLGARRDLRVALVVGGIHASEQILKLRSGSQVVVGTPGRVLDFLRDRTLSLGCCEVAVLDEADRMLDMGFIDDVTAILDRVPEERQTLLFSATVPPAIKKLLHRYMKDPVIVSTASGLATVSEIKQIYVESDFRDKFRALQKVLDMLEDRTAIIFTNTKRQAIDLDRMLWGHGYSAGALHGDQEQDARFRTLESFRRGDVKFLVATDVASRGLDIEDVGCVVNYEIPDEPESYVHRIGRTGRAQKTGLAISIVSGKEWESWQRILRDTGFSIERSGPERVRKSGERGGRGQRFGGRDERDRGGRRERDRGPRGERGPDRGPRGEREPRHGARRGEGAPADRNGGEPRDPALIAADEFGSGILASSEPGPGSEGASEQSGERRGEPAAEDRGRRRRRRRRGGERDMDRDPRGRGGEPRRSEEGRDTELPAGRASFPGDDSFPAKAPEDEAGEFEEAGAPSSDAPARWPEKSAAERQQPPARMRLEDLDDEYLKVDYFDVDPSLIKEEPARAADRGGPHRGDPHRGERGGDRGGEGRPGGGPRGRRRRGQRGGRRGEGGSPGPRGPQGRGPQGEGPGHAAGAPGASAHGPSAHGGRSEPRQPGEGRGGQPRRGRRRRRRGGGGGGQAGGGQGGGGSPGGGGGPRPPAEG